MVHQPDSLVFVEKMVVLQERAVLVVVLALTVTVVMEIQKEEASEKQKN